MTVDKIKSNKILITLGDDDMRDFSLDYNMLSLYDSHSRKILMRIVQVACFKTDIEIRNKRMLVEALPTVNGCMLLLTVEDRKGKRYHLQGAGKANCYKAGDSKNFLDVIQLLYRQNVCCNKISAYELDGVYYLIFDYPAVPKRYKRILHEYCKKCGENIVITSKDIDDEVYCVRSIQDALRLAEKLDGEKVYIIGGASVYEQALAIADRLCLTEIHDTPTDADAFFPEYGGWKETAREEHTTDEKHHQAYAFVDYVKP